ncbi:hypothetical protein [Paenibacillus elgii]|uniref:Spore coat protein D n=1 Tax=Paenibacillus elgii TaxID=189691 RepID=A0A2T6G2F3_9BACL|nr:hypothetical protein [Paenibacillus elgii]MCM3272364.1 hypothetical protein [Paenibacillus elgii]PUA38357.1 hypothetical protein C8Z91_15095 [Paenibacillus elgii]
MHDYDCYSPCPTKTVYDPPVRIYRDFFHPQIVQVVRPVEIVNRHHCVPCPQHVYSYSERDEWVKGAGDYKG